MSEARPKASELMKKFGRPTTYKKEYCQLLVDHMAEGLSFESFSAIVYTPYRVLYQWLERQPDFALAKDVGEGLGRLFWEKAGRNGCLGKIPNFNTGAWTFFMRNRFQWKNVTQVDVKSDIPENGHKIDKLLAELDKIVKT